MISALRKSVIILCLLIPLGTILYKTKVLGIPFLPIRAQNLWKIELSLNHENLRRDLDESIPYVYLPVPSTTPTQNVRRVEVLNKGVSRVLQNEAGRLVRVPVSELQKDDRVRVAATVRLKDKAQTKATKRSKVKLNSRQKKRYLETDSIEETNLATLKELSQTIFFEADTGRQKLEKIYFYIADEILLMPDVDDLTEVLTLGSGSSMGRARLFAALARLNGVPARIGLAVEVLPGDSGGPSRYMRTFYNEVYLDGRWEPVHVNEKSFGEIPENVIVLYRDFGERIRSFDKRAYYSVYVEPVKYAYMDSGTFVKELNKTGSFWSAVSLHHFPLSVQTIFYTILLIPFGTVILSLSRNVVGVTTFGIFTPILLALFFLETPFLFSMCVFSLIVFFGFAQRYLLDKFYLLAVPRLSIMLTFVIMIYVGFAIWTSRTDILPLSTRSLSYFPIVIITVFIERFSIYYIEEGPLNTFKTLLGTLFVVALCYLLFSIGLLKVVVFNHPELLFLAVGANILIGRYTGYRLLEFSRFALFKESKV